MIPPPTFTSLDDYVARLGDVAFWQPILDGILERHDLSDPTREPEAGFNPTYPTFVCGDVVVKLFGYSAAWRESHATERAAHARIATDEGIAAPMVLAEGRLHPEHETPWPYLISTRMTGVSMREADLSAAERLTLATDLGTLMSRVHALPAEGRAADEQWGGLDIAAAATRSSLPSHLAAQAGAYVRRLEPHDRVFVHGDLCAMHVFVEHGRLAGIIDWGDAAVTDRHYEIIQLFRDVFACDAALLRAFLNAYDWPTTKHFPRQALGWALIRQAVGLVQHNSMDVFEPIAQRFPLDAIATLDDLAAVLFDV